MDHYIPKRRVPVTLWSRDLQGVAGALFLDLDATGVRHQTLLTQKKAKEEEAAARRQALETTSSVKTRLGVRQEP